MVKVQIFSEITFGFNGIFLLAQKRGFKSCSPEFQKFLKAVLKGNILANGQKREG